MNEQKHKQGTVRHDTASHPSSRTVGRSAGRSMANVPRWPSSSTSVFSQVQKRSLFTVYKHINYKTKRINLDSTRLIDDDGHDEDDEDEDVHRLRHQSCNMLDSKHSLLFARCKLLLLLTTYFSSRLASSAPFIISITINSKAGCANQRLDFSCNSTSASQYLIKHAVNVFYGHFHFDSQ